MAHTESLPDVEREVGIDLTEPLSRAPILMCHNYYQQTGGEDQSFDAEVRLLSEHGHNVITYTVHNDEIAQMRSLDVAARTIWNHRTYRDVRAMIRRHRPQLMHCTNTFPLMSPAVYFAARHESVPVVQTIRNYRLRCLNGLFLRNGRVCEDCADKAIPWPGVVHKCYRNSRSASAVVASSLSVHRGIRTGANVALYVTLTEFAREKLVDAGLPAARLVVKPNFVDPDPGVGTGAGGYAVFVGRLSSEKGIETMLSAWSECGVPLPLKIVGDGPLAPEVRSAAARCPSIDFLGRRSLEEVLDLIGEASVLVLPSECYETFGRTIIEAFAKGTPVVTSRLGATTELVDDGRTGRHFEPGNPLDLALQLRRLSNTPQASLRSAARAEFERRYTGPANHVQLTEIYRRAVAMSRPWRPGNGTGS